MKTGIQYFVLLFALVGACKKSESPGVTYQDDLSADKGNWLVNSTVNDQRNFSNGHYNIRVISGDYVSYSVAPTNGINFPYSVQVDGVAVLDNPSQVGGIGVIFNYFNNKNSWAAEVYSNGVYRIFSIINGSSVTIKQEASASINQGSTAKNTVKVVQNATSADLYINFSFVRNFAIPLPAGSFKAGVLTGTTPNFTPVTGQFNNFKLTRN